MSFFPDASQKETTRRYECVCVYASTRLLVERTKRKKKYEIQSFGGNGNIERGNNEPCGNFGATFNPFSFIFIRKNNSCN